MNQNDESASDSDQSDEDFCPDKVDNSENLSEEESDDQISDVEGKGTEAPKRNKRASNDRMTASLRKKPDRNKQPIKPTKSAKNIQNEEEDKVRKTRQSGVEEENQKAKSSLEKHDLESDDEDKSRTEALWADFLSDVKPSCKPKSKASTTCSSNQNSVESPKPITCNTKKIEQTLDKPLSPKKVVVTEVREFAGEEIRIEKVVNADSIKENTKSVKAGISGIGVGVKRPATSGSRAIGSILDQIGKKKKLSVLEKTKLDWDNFKHNEGIDEQLQTFNKGKDGYLERQDFLQRTDFRQFEIEKSLRESKRTSK